LKLRALSLAGLLLLLTPSAFAHPLRTEPRITSKPAELTASDGAANDYFGQSVAISGNTIVVGAPTEFGAGAAYVYTMPENGWETATETAELLPTDGDDGDQFGASIAISGDTIVVGAPGAAGGGAAYLFTLPASGGTDYDSKELQPSGAPAYAEFGASVASSGTQVVVGAPGLNVTPSGGTTQNASQGGVYTFALPGGSSTGLLTAADGAAYDELGTSVAVSGGAVAAGAPGRQVGSNRSQGTVYVWTGNKVAELTAPNGYFKAGLGRSLAMTNDTIVAGAPGAGSTPGDVYVYTMPQTGWASGIQPADLTDSEFGTGGLGTSVAVSGNTIAAGAPDASSSQGAAFTYTMPTNGWTGSSSVDGLQVFNGGAGYGLGSGVGVSSGTLVAGAASGTVNSHTSQGAAWVWSLQPPLVVNSTGDADDDASSLSQGICNTTPTAATPICTFAAAIETANKLGGGKISFDIPAGNGNTFDGSIPRIVPTQRLNADDLTVALPFVTSPVTIDATTQPGAGQVEIINPSDAAEVGLYLASSHVTIQGVAISGFWEADVDLDTGSGYDTLTDDRFGTIDAGQSPSLSAGTGTARTNVFVADGLTLYPIDAAEENIEQPGSPGKNSNVGHDVFQGDVFGGAKYAHLNAPCPTDVCDYWGLGLASPDDTIGGSASGQGNTFNHAGADLYYASGAVVQGNTFTASDLSVGVSSTIGGVTSAPGVAPGNVISKGYLAVLGRDVVQGNHVTGGEPGIEVLNDDNTIGGARPTAGNLVADTAGDGSYVSSVADGIADPTAWQAAVTVAGADNGVTYNQLSNNSGAGVRVFGNGNSWAAPIFPFPFTTDSAAGNTIEQNEMTRNTEGIIFGPLGLVPNSLYTHFHVEYSDPNDLQPYPVLLGLAEKDGETLATLHVIGLTRGSYEVELYSQPSCSEDSVSYGQGEKSLGFQSIAMSALGATDTLHFSGASGPVTTTVTAPDGSTSEFSPCLTIGHAAPAFTKSGVWFPGSLSDIDVVGTSGGHAADRSVATVAAAHKLTATLQPFCPPVTTNYCAGTIALKAGRTKIETLTLKLAPDSLGALTFKLSGSLAKKLERVHRIALTATIQVRDGANPDHKKTRTQRLELVLAKRT
jgi:hypothetical protein